MNKIGEIENKIYEFSIKTLKNYLLQKLKENLQVKHDDFDFDLIIDIDRYSESSYGNNFEIDLNSDEYNCTIRGKGKVHFYEFDLDKNGFKRKNKEFIFDSLKLDFKNFATPEFRVIQIPNIYLD